MKLSSARMIAEALARELEPACERLQVAGSIRRQRPNVTDVELVAIPRFEERPKVGQAALFAAEVESVSLAWEFLEQLRVEGRVRPITPGRGVDEKTGEYPDDRKWEEKRIGESRYLRLWLPRPRIKVDLFLTDPERWGATLLVRTGSAEFNQELVVRCRDVGARFADGGLFVYGKRVPTAEEGDVFNACGFEYVPPERRESGAVLRKAAA